LSKIAADVVTPTPVDMLELPGQPALSEFRLDKLLHRLRRRDDRVTGIDAAFIYFVDLAGPLTGEQSKHLESLLLSGDEPATLSTAAHRLFVVPRHGTISPWSSKATDIAVACDLTPVRRIERGICYSLQIRGQPTHDEVLQLSSVLFDRMTETVLESSRDAAALFEAHEPAPLVRVPLQDEGRDALVRAGPELRRARA
jgi:phosphoribosylformylglycinamidine synthase